MIVCVCGMIGAGKSEYARSTGKTVSDSDVIGSKKKQLEFTLKNHVKEEEIYHITCYPTQEELEEFARQDVKYVWINTVITQCRINILTRGRQRDIEDIQEVLRKNKVIQQQYINSDIRFEVVDVFKTNERW